MRPSAVLLFGIAGLAVQAQSGYEKLYDYQGFAPHGMNELPSHNILLNLQYSRGGSVIDQQGNVVLSAHYWHSQLGGPFNIRKRSANEFFFATQYVTPDSCFAFFHQQYPAIGLMDSLCHVQSVHYYVMAMQGCENNPRNLDVTADGGVITWGRNWNFFALRTDENGAPIWGKYFGYNIGLQSFGRRGSFQFIRELPGGDLLAAINMDTAGVVVARLDAAGNFLWCKSYMRPCGMVHDCLIESDDSFIITGATDTIASTNTFVPLPPDYQPKLFMLKLDGGGDVQWCRGYDSTPNRWYGRGGSRILKAHDGNYVVLASLGMENYNLEYRSMLMKTDQDGDTLWTRTFGRNGAHYLSIDLLEAADGGFIFNGSVWGDVGPVGLNSSQFIYKCDSLGHLPCNEQWSHLTITELFPVDSSFTLTSTDGATMYEVSLTDTAYAPARVLDGCTFTTGMHPRLERTFGKPIVRPNPTTGRFTVQFDDPLRADSFYTVYDALGKLLYQQRWPPGKQTEEVDLSRFGSGTYVIRFTSPEGSCYERVAVE